MKIKICKTCGTENSPSDLECHGCMGDISGIRPVEKVEKNAQVEEPGPDTASYAGDLAVMLVLVSMSTADNGVTLSVQNGDILGREHIGKNLFAAYCTVSREHAKITCANGTWMIEDVGSTNGTHVNGRKLEAGRKYPLKAEDIVSLSKSCEFLVRKEVGG